MYNQRKGRDIQVVDVYNLSWLSLFAHNWFRQLFILNNYNSNY
jgi:hypothetical protein